MYAKRTLIQLSSIFLQIIAMENNCIRAYGTFSEIENNDPELAREWSFTIANENSSDVQLR